MMLPQRPYFPVGSLQAAIVYPAEAGAFSPDRVSDALIAVGLPAACRAAGARKRTGTGCSRSANSSALGSRARCCTRRNILFLDEATASLDEPSEATLYRLLEEKLPATTIVSIGHRSTLQAFHQRNVVLARDGDQFALRRNAAEDARSRA